MARYFSAKKMRENLGEKYKAGMNEYIKKLTSLGYKAMLDAYQKGHTNEPREYRDVLRFENGDLQYYKHNVYDELGNIIHRRNELKKRKSPVRDGKWRHNTRNLHDSFGCAVYVGGVLVEDSITFLGKELTRRPDELTLKTGRQELMRFFHNSHYGRSSGDVVLVCVAAMYYTKFLENGWHRGRYKIQVISAARDYIDRHWKEYVGDMGKAIVFKGIAPISNEKVGLL